MCHVLIDGWACFEITGHISCRPSWPLFA